jgi:biopolymer transport protein ExbD
MPAVRRPRYIAAPAGEAPISDLNTTPLIDVMLVLLIMFILTIPTMTHSVKIDLPTGPATFAEPEVHRLDLAPGGSLAWDGSPIAEAALPARLAEVAAAPDAVLQLRSDGEARYEDFDRILAAVKRAGVERLTFVGNDRFVPAIDG